MVHRANLPGILHDWFFLDSKKKIDSISKLISRVRTGGEIPEFSN